MDCEARRAVLSKIFKTARFMGEKSPPADDAPDIDLNFSLREEIRKSLVTGVIRVTTPDGEAGGYPR